MNFVAWREPHPSTDPSPIELMAEPCVYLNGPMANFVDVIAPYRLIQCKHTSQSDAHTIVDLKVELAKAGILNTSSPPNAIFLASLVRRWRSNEPPDQGPHGGCIRPHTAAQRSMYPIALLNAALVRDPQADHLLRRVGDPSWLHEAH